MTLAMGADRAIHLSDRVFAVADTIGTSRTLALAVEKEGADLVLCGRKTVDSETWQVPPEVGGVPRLGAAHERRPARARRAGAARAARDRRGLRHLRARAAGRGLGHRRGSTRASGRRSGTSRRPRPRDASPSGLPPTSSATSRRTIRRFGQTGSPTRVLAVKDVTPDRHGEIVADSEQAAERVLELLAEADGPPASAWEKPERLGAEPGRSYDCWTVVELVEGAAASRLARAPGQGARARGKAGREQRRAGPRQRPGGTRRAKRPATAPSASCSSTTRAWPTTTRRRYAAALRRVVEDERPHVLLIPSTTQGRDYGPRVAGELELGMTGDCVDLGIDRAGRLIQYKPAYGGNIVSVIMGATTPQLATVRPGMFLPVEPRDDAEAELVERTRATLPEPRTRLVAREHDPRTAGYELDAAAVVPLRRQGRRRAGGAPGARGPCGPPRRRRRREPRRHGRRLAPQEPPDRPDGTRDRAAPAARGRRPRGLRAHGRLRAGRRHRRPQRERARADLRARRRRRRRRLARDAAAARRRAGRKAP